MGEGWNWGRKGRGWRCGTVEQRVVQEDGARAKTSVQVKLFIALYHGPFWQAPITASIIPLFRLSSYTVCSSYPGKGRNTFTSESCPISVFLGSDITFYKL